MNTAHAMINGQLHGFTGDVADVINERDRLISIQKEQIEKLNNNIQKLNLVNTAIENEKFRAEIKRLTATSSDADQRKLCPCKSKDDCDAFGETGEANDAYCRLDFNSGIFGSKAIAATSSDVRINREELEEAADAYKELIAQAQRGLRKTREDYYIERLKIIHKALEKS